MGQPTLDQNGLCSKRIMFDISLINWLICDFNVIYTGFFLLLWILWNEIGIAYGQWCLYGLNDSKDNIYILCSILLCQKK